MKFLHDKKKRGKVLEIVLIVMIALLLCFAVWQVFFKKDKDEAAISMTGEEERLIAILEQIEGVGKADVMIGTAEDGQRSVVVVCEGANSISVLIDVREAAATALGISEKQVKIYLKNQ